MKFYYDDSTNWVTDNVTSRIATAPGSFQSELGCPGDWQPDCLRSWLQDADGDNVYSLATRDIPAGDYEVKVAIDESWALNYGAGGVQNGANIPFSVPSAGSLVVFNFDSATNELTVSGELPKGDLARAEAYWLAADLVAWRQPTDAAVALHYSALAELSLSTNGVEGGASLALSPAGTVSGALADKWPHLSGMPLWRVAAADAAKVPGILKGQFAVAARDAGGAPLDATGLQHAGVLDDLYTYDGALGATFAGGAPTLRVWAPTAQSVKVQIFDGPDPSQGPATVRAMTFDAATGVWSVAGTPDWNRKYYRYEVDVFVRSTGRIEKNLVTDPYSVSLSMNSALSQIVNLDDADLAPPAWSNLRKPRLDAPEDATLYELHVRDFSVSDPSVPDAYKGTFMAFSLPQTNGMKHLRRLATAGVSHVHLLPAFDCASINEDRSAQVSPGDLSFFAPDSEQQQAAVGAVRDQDAFNWCYDPFHYTAPEGSYATNPDGPARIREFREMVAGLKQVGLRVVMDVVYNHTSGSGQGPTSVLDRIVPGYYYRLNPQGFIETSTCCANTASEHAMMEKLMLDSLKTWAADYKVDGFRFDLMGHHSRANIEKARDMLQAIDPTIYLYGEGWNFGEVANNARFVQATQANMGDGTGVGSFNDRLRDAARGGGPFDGPADQIRRQGFINGLFTNPNAANSGAPGERDELLRLSDWVRIGLAGSLRDYRFETYTGDVRRAAEVDYFGNPGAGYTSDPQEVINYVAAHDNETLFDVNQYKLPAVSDDETRVRAQVMGNAIVALAQGVPFFHAGQEMLRSKSMDRNSFNSGDWFNLLDFTYADNGFRRGLPPEWDNAAAWSTIRPILGDANRAVERDDIEAALARTIEYFRIRKSSPLFRLRTAAEVSERLRFHNTGPSQVPGLIVMSLRDATGAKIVVVFNGTASEQTYALDLGRSFDLHEVLKESVDRVVRGARYDAASRAFVTPARTVAVFVAN